MRFSRGLRFAIVALFALVGASLATPADAQGSIRITVAKGGWVIGGSLGSGTLRLGGRSYPLNVGGLSAGLVFGGSVTEFTGSVSNIRVPSDINGVYGAVGAGGAVVGGVRVITLRNSRGVTLRLQGAQIGLMANLDLSGMSISLR
ncbi:MAG: hypothetical protein AB7K35_14580 [Pseudorhodoplanes sp.]